MTLRRGALFLGLFSLLICLTTWAMDLSDLVVKCIYCRNERTIIGLLGILLLLPIYPYLTRYLSLVLGFYGASLAAHQIMMTEQSPVYSMEMPLSIAALLFIIGQVYFIFIVSKKKRQGPKT